MNLTELEQLAKAAIEERTNPKGRLHYFITEFYNSANPETILRLIELMREMGEALELHARQYPQMVKGYTADAIDKYKEMK